MKSATLNPFTNGAFSKMPYPSFGMLMQERSYSSTAYRFGFNGKEKDDQINVEGGDYDFGARIYDGRLGRWLSLDPFIYKYPSKSPFCAMSNTPILIVDIDGNVIGIIATSMARETGAGSHGHMAIIVGNDDIGWWVFSIEDPKKSDYIVQDEIVFITNVNKVEAYLSGTKQAVLYGHRENTYKDLLNYVSTNAPGVKNSEENKGFGYDRILTMNNVTPQEEAEFLKTLNTLNASDFGNYEICSNNCSSFAIDQINENFNNLILDKTIIDDPNKEFDEIKHDTKNWTIMKDEKANNDDKRDAIRYQVNQKTNQNETNIVEIECDGY